jgi:hypothetical protein
MLTEYIQAAMGKARYEILDDGTYYGEIPLVAAFGPLPKPWRHVVGSCKRCSKSGSS